MALGRIVVGERVGDQLGEGHEDGLDDAQAGSAQGRPGLGDLDDDVDDVGHLGLGGAVGQLDAGVDAALLEEAAGEIGILGGDSYSSRKILDPLER